MEEQEVKQEVKVEDPNDKIIYLVAGKNNNNVVKLSIKQLQRLTHPEIIKTKPIRSEKQLANDKLLVEIMRKRATEIKTAKLNAQATAPTPPQLKKVVIPKTKSPKVELKVSKSEVSDTEVESETEVETETDNETIQKKKRAPRKPKKSVADSSESENTTKIRKDLKKTNMAVKIKKNMDILKAPSQPAFNPYDILKNDLI